MTLNFLDKSENAVSRRVPLLSKMVPYWCTVGHQGVVRDPTGQNIKMSFSSLIRPISTQPNWYYHILVSGRV